MTLHCNFQSLLPRVSLLVLSPLFVANTQCRLFPQKSVVNSVIKHIRDVS